jgi:superoxide dismutase
LEPVITASTIGFHHGKHHKAYVDNLNKLVAGTEYAALSLEKIIAATAGQPEKKSAISTMQRKSGTTPFTGRACFPRRRGGRQRAFRR